MFPDINDNELSNNGENISPFPPPCLHHNPCIHIKLHDDKRFRNGFLRKYPYHGMWHLYSGTSQKVAPTILSEDRLKDIFVSFFRRGFISNQHDKTQHISKQQTKSHPFPRLVLNDKLTIKLPTESTFCRGYILKNKDDSIVFGEGVKRTQIITKLPFTIDDLHGIYSKVKLSIFNSSRPLHCRNN